MTELIVAPEIDLRHQPIVIFCENKDMAWMFHDMLKPFKPADMQVVLRLADLNEMAKETSLGVVIANPESELKAKHVIAAVRHVGNIFNPFAVTMLLTSVGTKKAVKAATTFGYDGLVALPTSANRLWKTVEGLSKKEREYVRVEGYFGPNHGRVNAEQATPKSA